MRQILSKFKFARNFVLCAINAFVLIAVAPAFGSSFKIQAPYTWKKVASEGENKQIYINSQSKSNETIVLQVDPISDKEASFQEKLSTKSKEMAQIRSEYFASAGLEGYAIIDIQNRKTKVKGMDSLTVIQSRFQDLKNREVQMLERQYVAKSKLYTVTYLLDGPALNDSAAVERALDYFVPTPPGGSRLPASEPETVTGPGQIVNLPALASSSPGTLTELNMSDPNNQKRCEAFCKDEPTKCRKPGEAPFTNSMKDMLGINQGWGCLVGLKDGIWGMAEGLWDLAAGGVKFAYKYTKSWLTDGEYKTQVHAAVGTMAAEIYKDPVGLAGRIAAVVGESLKATLGNFFLCANSGEQWRQICSFATNFIPVGLLFKMISKAPMAAAEIVQLNEALAKLKMTQAAHVAIANDVKGAVRAADGSMVYNLDHGVTAVVPAAKDVAPAAKDVAPAAAAVEAERTAAKVQVRPAPTPIAKVPAKVTFPTADIKPGKIAAEAGPVVSPADLKKPPTPAGSSLGWESKDTLRKLVSDTTPDQLNRIDKVISNGGGEETIRDLEAINRMNRGPLLARIMENGDNAGNELAESSWLRGKIKELANPSNHTATSVREWTAQAVPARQSSDLPLIKAVAKESVPNIERASARDGIQPLSHEGGGGSRLPNSQLSHAADPAADLRARPSNLRSQAAQQRWAADPVRAPVVRRIQDFDRERIKAGLAPVSEDAIAALSKFDDPRTGKVLSALEEALDSRNEDEIQSAHAILNLLKAEKDPDLGQAIKGAAEKYKSQKMCEL